MLIRTMLLVAGLPAASVFAAAASNGSAAMDATPGPPVSTAPDPAASTAGDNAGPVGAEPAQPCLPDGVVLAEVFPHSAADWEAVGSADFVRLSFTAPVALRGECVEVRSAHTQAAESFTLYGEATEWSVILDRTIGEDEIVFVILDGGRARVSVGPNIRQAGLAGGKSSAAESGPVAEQSSGSERCCCSSEGLCATMPAGLLCPSDFVEISCPCSTPCAP